MKTLTIAYVTSREEPLFDWFTDSLARCVAEDKRVRWGDLRVIVVDLYRSGRMRTVTTPTNTIHCAPKPSVWQGTSRLTKQDWWATANARNTALCLCETEWIAFLDDRCVIQPGYFNAILEAQGGNYIVAGTYEKRHGMTCEKGVIRHGGIVTGEDHRAKYQKENNLPNPMQCNGEWLFGCTFALPHAWAMEVNGVDETCDGLGMEDVIFGCHLSSAGKPLRFDSRMKIVEDRTPDYLGSPSVKRDKGISPNDKSHAALHQLAPLKRAQHKFNIVEVRRDALNGRGFPKPWGPTVDWYDNQPLGEMVPA